MVAPVSVGGRFGRILEGFAIHLNIPFEQPSLSPLGRHGRELYLLFQLKVPIREMDGGDQKECPAAGLVEPAFTLCTVVGRPLDLSRFHSAFASRIDVSVL